MAKRKVIRKTNRILNLYGDGGKWTQQSKDAAKSAFSSKNLGSTLGSLGSAVESIASAGANNAQLADTSDIESEIDEAQAYKVSANNNDDLMSEWASFNPLEEVSYKDVRGGSTGQRLMNTVGAMGSGASAGASVGGPWGAVAGAAVGLGSAIAGWFTGDAKAKRKQRALNNEIRATNNRNWEALSDKAENIDTQNDLAALANFSAYGGPMYIFADGGGIHIKKANRGKFTESAKRAGMGVQEYARHVLANKDKYSSTLVKRANFARNASKWKHATGGILYDNGGNLYTIVPNIGQHGGDFSNGVTFINNGGTHEENPYEGIQIGMDPQGIPNLVEQGEVIYNDYVFSNRLTADSKLLKENNLPTSYSNHSFADIAERLNKESSERPNDPISKRGLKDSMTKLQNAQEQVRAKLSNMKKNKNNNLFFSGGDTNPWDEAEYPWEDEGISAKSTSKESKSGNINKWTSALRYAPVIGSGMGVVSDAFGWTNKPDYSNSDLIGNVANNLNDISYTPINRYLTYKPLDRNYYINKLNSQSGATRRAIINQSNGNRATAMAGLVAADYNYLNSLGDLARKSEEYNQAQRERVQAFNRGTDQINAEMALRANIANQNNDKLRLQARTAQAQMRDQVDNMASAAKSANLSTFIDNLGNLGVDSANRADVMKLIRDGALSGTSARDLKDLFGANVALAMLQERGMSDDEARSQLGIKSKGGKLRTKRRGLTY